MGAGEPTTREIRGDGLSLKLRSNKQVLEITGDGCTISMTKNVGCVRIVGDGCRLRIDLNMGDVEYTGDGGRVLLGAKSIRDKVRYNGDGGKIIVDGESRTKNRKFEESLKREDGRKEGVRSKGVEETENVSKETKRTDRERKVVKIVTTFRFDEKIINEWFVNPKKVVRSFDGASFVKIVPKERKTTVEVKC